MQLVQFVRILASLEFQSSPVPRDGCNGVDLVYIRLPSFCFNPHPSRGTGATIIVSYSAMIAIVSILTRPEGRVQPPCKGQAPLPNPVSILTRPEGRVQRARKLFNHFWSRGFNPHPSRGTGATHHAIPTEPPQLAVSILTRPEGRVQLKNRVGKRIAPLFQSSPVPRDGCNVRRNGRCIKDFSGFNPHPSRGTGATTEQAKTP